MNTTTIKNYSPAYDYLSDKADLYKLIVENANEGVWIKNSDHTTGFVNEKMASMLGYSVEEIIGRSFFDFVFDDDKKEVESRHNQRVKGASDSYELAFRAKSGKQVWTHINACPLEQNGVFIGSLAMVSDITEHKEREVLREERERHYRSLFEHSPIPTWDEDFSQVKEFIDHLKLNGITDIREYFESNPKELFKCASLLVVNDINAAVVQLNEAENKKYVIDNYHKLIGTDSGKYALIQLEAIANNQKSCEFDARLRTFKGKNRHVHLKWTVVDGYEDNYKKVYLTTTDVTERILAENERLKASNAQKELLLKEIHHRVKNNLQIITSLLRLQANSLSDEKVAALFDMSLHRINSMAFVHDMLYQSNDFSQIDFQQYLNSLLDSLLSSLRRPEQEIELKNNSNRVQLNINTSILIGLIVNEAVTNSIKHAFNHNNAGTIVVSIKPTDVDTYILEISDDGEGYELASNIESIDSLGLQLIFSMVEQLNGSLSKIAKNKGTHYRIEFREIIENSKIANDNNGTDRSPNN